MDAKDREWARDALDESPDVREKRSREEGLHLASVAGKEAVRGDTS